MKRMQEKKKDELLYDHNHDGIDRRGFLKCMAWAGTGAFCVMKGGVLKSYSLSSFSDLNTAEAKGELSFVQISDSHMGFNKPAEFDTVDQVLKSATPKDIFYVPGEHEVLNDDGKQFLERYGKGSKGGGWYSFDKKGVHFIGLVNVMNLKAGGLGTLGH